jgi:hypothetical protein
MEFDEEKAIEFIRQQIGEVMSKKYDDDELLNVIDIIWDYYEDSGFLDITLDEDEEDADVEKIIAHVKKMLAKDKFAKIEPDDVEPIVKAQLDYEASLDEF